MTAAVRTRVTRMATPPQLTPEQRTAALAKAAEARAARAELKNQLKMGSVTLSRSARLRPTAPSASSRSSRCSSRCPGVGKVKARKSHGRHRHRRQPPCAGPWRSAEAVAARSTRQVRPGGRADRRPADHRRLRPRWRRQGNDRRRTRRARSRPVAEQVVDDPRAAPGRARRRVRVHRPRPSSSTASPTAASSSGPSSSATTTARPIPRSAPDGRDMVLEIEVDGAQQVKKRRTPTRS